MKRTLVWWLLVAAWLPGVRAEFRFRDVNDASLGLWEDDRPVLVYNHGIIRREGVPADRARSSYVHPLYGLSGEVLTDDFPEDHYHHHGIFWTWPEVVLDGPIDDRDAGVLETRQGTLLITTFTSLAYEPMSQPGVELPVNTKEVQ